MPSRRLRNFAIPVATIILVIFLTFIYTNNEDSDNNDDIENEKSQVCRVVWKKELVLLDEDSAVLRLTLLDASNCNGYTWEDKTVILNKTVLNHNNSITYIGETAEFIITLSPSNRISVYERYLFKIKDSESGDIYYEKLLTPTYENGEI